MEFVYFGYDFMLGCAHRLIEDGHELSGIFTFPCDNVFNFNTQTIALAQKLDIPYSIEKPRDDDVELLKDRGCKAFIAAGYLYKIPKIENAYGLNIHPSLLPKGRSLMPIPYIILDHPEAAGFTIHKLAKELDSGDILSQEPLPLSNSETVETLSARMAEKAPDALSKIMSDLPLHWENALPQKEEDALYFPPPDDNLRFLDWKLPLARLDKIARAFGHYGSLARFNNDLCTIYAHEIIKEKHDFPPGSLMANEKGVLAIAVAGGYFIPKKFEKIPET